MLMQIGKTNSNRKGKQQAVLNIVNSFSSKQGENLYLYSNTLACLKATVMTEEGNRFRKASKKKYPLLPTAEDISEAVVAELHLG